mmetsp:Transcript_25435/g.55292  ORF Transcript_25435/g.55292 Transcript_25435/m.55292 type:complete len:231 (-) Transcript_25435:133-825(-)
MSASTTCQSSISARPSRPSSPLPSSPPVVARSACGCGEADSDGADSFTTSLLRGLLRCGVCGVLTPNGSSCSAHRKNSSLSKKTWSGLITWRKAPFRCNLQHKSTASVRFAQREVFTSQSTASEATKHRLYVRNLDLRSCTSIVAIIWATVSFNTEDPLRCRGASFCCVAHIITEKCYDLLYAGVVKGGCLECTSEYHNALHIQQAARTLIPRPLAPSGTLINNYALNST